MRHEQNGFVKFLTVVLLLLKVCQWAAGNIFRLMFDPTSRFRHFSHLGTHCVNVDYNLAGLDALTSAGQPVGIYSFQPNWLMSNNRQCGQCLGGSHLEALKGIKLWMKLGLFSIRDPQPLALHCLKLIPANPRGHRFHIRLRDFL
jgi:hypothetical protein